MPVQRRSSRPSRPTRVPGFGTTSARGATFAGQTRGTGLTAIPQAGAGPLGEAFRGKYAQFDTVCKGWIGLALANTHIRPKINFHNVGSGPELVVCGYFLAHRYLPGRDLLFQEDKVVIDDRERTSRKKFIVDVAINNAWGMTVYLNIDGHYFHTKTELQEFKDAIRDRHEGRTGIVVDIPDTMTWDASSFVTFLHSHGVAA